MSKQSKKSIRKAEAKAARKAAKRAAELQVATPPAKQSVAVRVDAFMARHAPSDTDLRWYRMLKHFAPLAIGLGASAAAVFLI
jgi:hypothetical protein